MSDIRSMKDAGLTERKRPDRSRSARTHRRDIAPFGAGDEIGNGDRNGLGDALIHPHLKSGLGGGLKPKDRHRREDEKPAEGSSGHA